MLRFRWITFDRFKVVNLSRFYRVNFIRPYWVNFTVFSSLAFGIRDTERYEFVTAVALAAYGIPADVADNSSLFHLKNYD